MTRAFVIPDRDEVLAELEPLTDVLWVALDAANAAAVHFFDEGPEGKSRPWDASVHANLTRYFAIPLLDAAGVKATEEGGDAPYQRIGLANNGICLQRGRFTIRVRKADDGRLPPPSSAAQEEFYAQQMSLPFNLVGTAVPEDAVNLITLWGIDPEHAMRDLVLACPSESKEPHWYRKIVHPALRLERVQQLVTDVAKDDFSEIVRKSTDSIRAHE